MYTPQTYTYDQLAVVLQRPASTLRGHLEKLETEHGFPPRLPCFENLWSKPAVDRWIDNNGQTAPAALSGDGLTSFARKYGAAA